MNVIGQRVKEARTYLGLSQENVAQALDLRRPAISEIEGGGRKVTAEELEKLSKLLHRPVAWFLGEFVEDADLSDISASIACLCPEDGWIVRDGCRIKEQGQ